MRPGLGLLWLGLCVLASVAYTKAAEAPGSPTVGVSTELERPPLFSGEPLSFWIQALKDKDPDRRMVAQYVLYEAGPSAREALPTLIETRICHDEATLPLLAVLAIDPQAKVIVRVCVARLKDTDPKLRTAAARLLGGVAALQPDAVLIGLSELLCDSNEEVRTAAISGLNELGPKALPAVAALIDALHDDCPKARQAAVNALHAIGPEAREAVIPLCIAMRDDIVVRHEAAATLEGFADDLKPAIPLLLGNLNHNDEKVRLYSCAVLAAYKPEAKTAVAPLCEILVHSADRANRYYAVCILGGIGPDAKAAIPAILFAQKDDYQCFRTVASEALEAIDPETADHVLKPH
jgi:HEAT repeat protein